MSRHNPWYSVSGNPAPGMSGLSDFNASTGGVLVDPYGNVISGDPGATDPATGELYPITVVQTEKIPPTSVSVYADTPYVIAQGNPVLNPAQAQSGWLDSMLKTAESAAKTFMTYKQANDFNAINLQRARQGLPPLNPQQYAPQVNFGVSSDIQQMILWGGAAVLVVMLIGSLRKRA